MKYDAKEKCLTYTKKEIKSMFWHYLITDLFPNLKVGDTLNLGRFTKIFIGTKTYNMLKKHYDEFMQIEGRI